MDHQHPTCVPVPHAAPTTEERTAVARRRPAPGSAQRRPQQPAARRPAARPAARKGRRGRRALAWLAGLVAAGAVLGVGGLAAAYAVTDVPDPNELADAQISTVYFSDGQTELGTFAARNREVVGIDEVPDVVQHAVLAAEDRSFYENRGVSPTGIARAVWNNVRGGSQQGGSTITQQYVKNYYLTSERSYARKAQEFILALKIDQQQTKDETLQDYLNTVYFGRGAYGVQAAAQAYFGRDVGELDVSQAALLAAVLKAPSALDPLNDPEGAAARVDYVLDGMVSEGWLSADDRAAAGLPETVQEQREDALRGPDGYLLTTVRAELESAAGLTQEQIDRGGYRIVTTFDARAQEAAVQAVQDQLPASVPEGLQVALSAIDPATGGVRAMYGGADYLQRNRNAVTQDIAQAGSTFKPFTLVAALEQGVSLRSTYSGASPMTVDGNTFRNFGGSSYGRINLVTATANSVNTTYVQLNDEVGPEATRRVAVDAGYPADTNTLGDADTTLSNVLGTASPHPIDVTQAYATFAAQGVRNDWHTIESIDDADGTRVYTASPTQRRVFAEDVMADTTYALQQVVQQGSGRYARNLGRPAAGKTGTSSGNMSAWFAGYTPQLAASVAMYQVGESGPEKLSLGGGEVTGGSYPVRIWTSFVRAALQGVPEADFPSPSYVGSSSSSGTASTPSSTPSRTAQESPSESPTATEEPTEEPTEEASDEATEEPAEQPTGTPTSTATGSPTAPPTAPDGGGGDGGGGDSGGGGGDAEASPQADEGADAAPVP